MLTPHTKTLTLELDWNICNIPYQVFEQDFKGWGVPHFYLKGRFNKVELTLDISMSSLEQDLPSEAMKNAVWE